MELFISLEFVKSVNGFVGTFSGDRHYSLPLDKEEIPFILADLMAAIRKFGNSIIVDFTVGEPYSIPEERRFYSRLVAEPAGNLRLIEWPDSSNPTGEDRGVVPVNRRAIRKILDSVLERVHS